MPDEPTSAREFLPAQKDLASLAHAADKCRGCILYLRARQTVFGEGPATARVVVLGEQPGDMEDQEGRPFVGPAGRLLDKALAEVGLDRSSLYVTNVVKHFSFEERGKRRIHKKPRQSEVVACRPWLEAELATIRPDVLLVLGATAGQAIFGTTFRVSQKRGQVLESKLAPIVVATIHPSSILRTPEEEREAAYASFVADLDVAQKTLRKQGRRARLET